MNRSERLTQFALKMLGCNQKELAEKLGVSTAQISKWRNGESISHEMEKKLGALLNSGDSDLEHVAITGSEENLAKWLKLFHYLAQFADESAETGYENAPLVDFDEPAWGMNYHTFGVLQNLGVAIPVPFPTELECADYDSVHKDDEQKREAFITLLLEEHKISSLVWRIYQAFTNVWGFHCAYLADHLYDDDLGLSDERERIESGLLDLAASKLDLDEKDYPGFREFASKTNRNFRKWLNTVKTKCIRAGVPLRAELMDMVNMSDEELRDEAERESLGFNDRNIHPDIYMNEVIRSLRVFHQIMPALLEKLGMNEGEKPFKLETEELFV